MSYDVAAGAERIRAILGASESQWNDWHWQMRHRVLHAETLGKLIALTDEEKENIRKAGRQFRFAAIPYALSLIDPDDPDCPMRRQIVPSGLELFDRLGEPDPLCELDHSPVPDLIHVYPDRVALCITDVCQVYCRHCFRKRRTHEKPPVDAFDRAVEYLAQTKEIRDVLITGGDPLMFSDRKLVQRLTRIRQLPHVQIMRLGTRAPAYIPMRITPELVEQLKTLHPLYVNVQFNHPRELTPEAVQALGRLVDAGIPVGNQSVLLKGVNDSLDVMRELVHALLRARVRPYYIFHPQLVEGTEHLRVPLEVGLDIHDGLEGFTSGLAVPLYILDTPYGKVPLSRSRIVDRDDEGFTVRGFMGQLWKEKNPRS
jgi:lysine 2,3-aminomutase